MIFPSPDMTRSPLSRMLLWLAVADSHKDATDLTDKGLRDLRDRIDCSSALACLDKISPFVIFEEELSSCQIREGTRVAPSSPSGRQAS